MCGHLYYQLFETKNWNAISKKYILSSYSLWKVLVKHKRNHLS